jgi:hypothetical protein
MLEIRFSVERLLQKQTLPYRQRGVWIGIVLGFDYLLRWRCGAFALAIASLTEKRGYDNDRLVIRSPKQYPTHYNYAVTTKYKWSQVMS